MFNVFLLIAVTCIKFLLIPSYVSTDFDVHRNWLALTHQLPLKQWYYENTSEWTLDYPPFFACFEWILSHCIAIGCKWLNCDPQIVNDMLRISATPIRTDGVIWLHRTTVIISDLLLFFALWRWKQVMSRKGSVVQSRIVFALFLFSPGLLFLDHVHFQYNGMLYGWLVWSIAEIYAGNAVLAAILFSILLCFKHIFIYIAPAYFIYLLRSYCCDNSRPWYKSLLVSKLVILGVSVIAVISIALGPFLALGQGPQLLARLFPFKRGLTHAYWAPNAWALYAFTDRLLAWYGQWQGSQVQTGGLTRGLVGDDSFAVLPSVPPSATFGLTLAFQLPCLVRLWMNPKPSIFLQTVIACASASFLFGWHVHEKAIMMIVLPWLLLLNDSELSSREKWTRNWILLTTAAHVSLWPLLFEQREAPILWFSTLAYYEASRILLHYEPSLWHRFYLYGMPLVYIVPRALCSIHPRFAFVPLMAISIYTAIAVLFTTLSFFNPIRTL